MNYASVRDWLQEHTLIEPSLLEGPGLETLIAERIATFGGGEPAYVAELARSPDEIDRLIAGIAVPETWLFRYPRSYELLLGFLERRLAAGAASLRMLSIGCATGQEAYCLGMTALHAGWSAERVRIEGIDRNGEFLRTAEIAEYSATSVRAEIPDWGVRYLIRTGDRITIDPSVRGVVRFARGDITNPAVLRGTGPFDVVFCRNVMIYLNATARERLLDSICAELDLGALLFVGHAEQLLCGAMPLRPVNAPHSFALERCDGARAEAEPRATAGRRAGLPTTPGPRKPELAAPAPSSPPGLGQGKPPEASLDDARDLADSGRVQEAESMIRAIIARRGPSATALELLGQIRLAVNDISGAKRFFEQAVYLDPHRSASLLQLALISERSGEAVRAATYWDRARRAAVAHEQERRS